MKLCWKYHSSCDGLATASLTYNRKVLKVMVDYFSVKRPQLWTKNQNNCLLFSYRGHWCDSGHIQSRSRNLFFLPLVHLIHLSHLYFSLALLYTVRFFLYLISFHDNLVEPQHWVNFENTEFQHKHKNILLRDPILLTFFSFLKRESLIRKTFTLLKPHSCWSGLKNVGRKC